MGQTAFSGEPESAARMCRVLNRRALPAGTVPLARFLLGKMLVRRMSGGVISGRIVETEAYEPGDPAGHGFRGMTARNRSLFGDLGFAYVYRAYGISYLLNVSSESAGVGAGVLIRALEPMEGVPIMRRNRGVERLRDLARGPGRLTQALNIDLALDGVDLCKEGRLWLGQLACSEDSDGIGEIGASERIGISKNMAAQLRFLLRDNPFVSGPRALRERV